LISNPEHLNQIGCHINMAGFIEISVIGQGGLVLPLRKGGFRICMFLKSNMFLRTWQHCNLFVNKRASISEWYKNFAGIYSVNCCNTRWIVVKSKMAV